MLAYYVFTCLVDYLAVRRCAVTSHVCLHLALAHPIRPALSVVWYLPPLDAVEKPVAAHVKPHRSLGNGEHISVGESEYEVGLAHIR